MYKDKKSERSVSVHLRLTRDEAAALERAAKSVGQTLSGWIRFVAMQAAKR